MSLLTPGLPAYETAMRSSTAELVTALRELLGAKLVAYVGYVSETRAVRQWAEGQRHPSAPIERRLRLAFQVAGLLAERDDARIIQSWFEGINPPTGRRLPRTVAPRRRPRHGWSAGVGRGPFFRGCRLGELRHPCRPFLFRGDGTVRLLPLQMN